MAYGNRTWISREEIAEIHDARMERMIDAADAAADRGDLETMSKCMLVADSAAKAAQNLRDTDRLSKRYRAA